MSGYRVKHIRRVSGELRKRYNELSLALDTGCARDNESIQLDGFRVRTAVDDFKTILTEARRMK
jgi:hypothetical protein